MTGNPSRMWVLATVGAVVTVLSSCHVTTVAEPGTQATHTPRMRSDLTCAPSLRRHAAHWSGLALVRPHGDASGTS